ncbi:dnaJ protein homolog [Bidens hawaiensis]|uniref:dnaJ protein homolog n=1 Tax=Bidens hawaiensis TaxID=980011 RepID=UPI00404A8149
MAFNELVQAYEVLSDPEKRGIYDKYGDDALKEGMGGGGESAFGGGASSSRGRRQRRGEDVVHPLKVSLEDLYNGPVKNLSVSRNIIFSRCKGKGSKSGIGEIINDKDRCTQCKGKKVVKEDKVLEVHVEKGMQNGRKITFVEEADEVPDTITGDIVFVLQQKEHLKFKRKGDDLFVEHTLSLIEALCGFQFALTHLDNRQLLIRSQPEEVVKPDQYKAINDEGMPMYQRPFMRGKLYIHFNMEFPDSLSPEYKALKALLPPKPSMEITNAEMEECEETTLYDVNIEDKMRSRQQRVVNDDDGAGRVQCAQQ